MMTTRTYDKKNYVFLYRGLLIVRDALLEFIVQILRDSYGNNWWESSVEPAFRTEDIEKLKLQFQKRFSNPDGPARPGTELYEILDLNYFGNVIEYNWKKVFAKTLNNDRTLLAYMKEAVMYRNPVAHTETGDLRDDDTFRGLDTGERLLRLINKNAADEIGKIKNEMRNAWIYEAIGLGTITPDKVGISIEKGFERLEEAIKNNGTETTDYSLFLENKETALSGIDLLQEHEKSPEIVEKNKLAFDSLGKLSQKYLATDFSQACILFVPLPKFTPKEVFQKTLHIRREIDALGREIKDLELDLEFQKNVGLEHKQFVLARIDLKKQLLNARRNDLEKIRSEITAPAFFSVTRKLDTAVQEEMPFLVSVSVKNLGKNKTKVLYQEGFSDDVILVDGAAGFSAEIEPDSSYEFTYTCYCDKSGSHSIFTDQLDYAEKLSGWDNLEDTTILALPGKGPQLDGKRYYRFAQNGIDIIIQLENSGDKTARAIQIHESIVASEQEASELSFQGNLKPKEKISISCTLNVSHISEINLPKTSQVFFSDNTGCEFSLLLVEPFTRLEYFSSDTDSIGRQREIEQVEKTLKIVSGLFTEGQLYAERRIILVEGVAGVGKTRFVREIQRVAKIQYDFQVFSEDVSTRSPLKRIIRSILDLDPNFTTKDDVWEKLHKFSPDTEKLIKQRGVLARFLASDYEKFEEMEMQYLINDILPIIRHLCQKSRYLLVFENAHDFSEGLEFELFQKLIKYASESQDISLSIVITYRPKESFPAKLLGSDTKESRTEKIILAPLTKSETASLTNVLIVYPTLCDELQDFVFEWSNGNPFYIKELLRQLISSEKGYIQRIGDNWYPSSNFQKNVFASQISEFLLQRAKEDTGEYFLALQVLSVVGLELPYRLLVPLFESNKLFQLKESELINILEKLERLGILEKSNTESLAELEYKFEHQLIRDAIYQDVRESVQHTFIREQLVSTVIKNKHDGIEIFTDPEEYYRQVARHLLYAGKDSQFANKNFLILAAHIEEIKHNFVRSLEYYNCFLSSCKNKENFFEQAQALVGVAIILKLQGNWKQASENLIAALEILKLEKNKSSKKQVERLKAKILTEQGFLFIKMKNYEGANDYLLNARLSYEGVLRSFYLWFLLPREKPFLEDLLEIYLNLAEIWYLKLDNNPSKLWDWRTPFFTFQWNMSGTYFRRAEMIAKKYGKFFSDNSLIINVLVREGEIYSFEKRELALEKLQNAVSSMEKQATVSGSNDYALERAYSYLAEIYRERNEPSVARKYYEEARQIQEKLQDIYGLAISNGGIGDLYVEQGVFDKAEYYLLEAFNYQQAVGDTDRFWRTAYSLTKISIESKDLEKARFYWNYARGLILERVLEIKPEKLDEIFEHIFALAKIYFASRNWQYALPLCLDLQQISLDNKKLVQVTEMLGKIYYEMKDPAQAIQALYQGLDLTSDPVKRADFHSMLGDICSETKDKNLMARAEGNYEECVKIFMENKLSIEALNAYDKLLHYMSSEAGSQRLSPLLHNLIELMFRKQKNIDIRFVEKAEKLFKKHERYKDAGDAFVHMSYKMAQLENPDNHQTDLDGRKPDYQREMILLKKAEEYYSKSRTIDDEIGGYYKLISTYFRMDVWDEISRCYKLILNTCMDSNEPQVFIDALREFIMLNDKFTFSDLAEVVPGVEKAQRTFESDNDKFADTIKFDLMVNIAKLFSHLADKIDDEKPELKLGYQNKALTKYNEIIAQCDEPGLKGVSYNDSALILHQINSLDEAKERFIQAVELAKGHENRFSEACSRANLANFLVEINDLSGASIEYEQSIGILAGMNNYWDERKKNQDNAPLDAQEIAKLRFDKKWCASVAQRYGMFLLRSDREKGKAWMHLARDIYEELQDQASLQSIIKWIEMLNTVFPSSLPGSFNPYPESSNNNLIFDVPSTNIIYVACAACGYSYSSDKKKCPRCSARTCPNCGQRVNPNAETCEYCDHWIG